MAIQHCQPNIVFVMADDHAAKAISAYGEGINHTPNIDRLAEEGMKFNHCYVTNRCVAIDAVYSLMIWCVLIQASAVSALLREPPFSPVMLSSSTALETTLTLCGHA